MGAPKVKKALCRRQRQGRPLSLTSLSKALAHAGGGAGTTHGSSRSCFDDWAAERTNYPTILVDRALAHGEANKSKAAKILGISRQTLRKKLIEE